MFHEFYWIKVCSVQLQSSLYRSPGERSEVKSGAPIMVILCYVSTAGPTTAGHSTPLFLFYPKVIGVVVNYETKDVKLKTYAYHFIVTFHSYVGFQLSKSSKATGLLGVFEDFSALIQIILHFLKKKKKSPFLLWKKLFDWEMKHFQEPKRNSGLHIDLYIEASFLSKNKKFWDLHLDWWEGESLFSFSPTIYVYTFHFVCKSCCHSLRC